MQFKRSNEPKIVRIKSIYLYLKNNGPMKAKDMMDEFGVCERTIQRDLAVLQFNDLVETYGKGLWKISNKKVKQDH